MIRFSVVLVVLFCTVYAGTVLAIQPGKTVSWDTPMGKVVFDGKNHAAAGLKCEACHSKIFKMRKGSTDMKMADISAGKFCGKCHNGTRAFATTDNCDICHRKK